jgi:hypothetical protein
MRRIASALRSEFHPIADPNITVSPDHLNWRVV